MPLGERLRLYILFPLLLVITLLGSNSPTKVMAQDIEADINATVEAIFNQLTPAERVGQLFMVSFEENDVGVESEVAELIQQYRVGSVYISAKNRNFFNSPTAPAQVLRLTNDLQTLAQTQPPVTSTATLTDTVAPPVNQSYTPLPLFVATNHEGDGFPETEIRGGMVDIPDPMALGATWQSENAYKVGQVVGHDLSVLGINMLFGPALDVLDNPRLDQGNGLGTRTFGGHPFWVGEMGQAYIKGVHEGSGGTILTISKHFPGFGSSDREVNQEVPTIFKSLDDLRQVDLHPFFQVTNLETDDPTTITDGLMTAHVRYQGLQANVPISFDARNLPALLALEELVPWRDAGGLIVSAPLGSPAALGSIATGSQTFPARRLTQDAFLAGSDILFLADFAFADEPDSQSTNIKDAILFFQEKYQNDLNFQANIDRSVQRIIRAKIKLYGLDLLNNPALNSFENLQQLGQVEIDLDQIAREGITLIAPSTEAGRAPLPDPPQSGENILIFTDDRLVRDCPDCPEFRLISRTALEEIVLSLFGPDATGQVSSEQINSLSFVDLKNWLEADDESDPDNDDEAETENSPDVGALINEADWLIFGMLNVDTQMYPESDAVIALLRNRLDNLRNKNLVLFAFNAPYFLGETEISQLTAYYAFYSKTPYYLEAAARLLFQQFEPSGASPVEIPAIAPLDLSPDPNQIIRLNPIHQIMSSGIIVPVSDSLAVEQVIDLEVGEGVLVRTEVIVDRNGNPVPDGTIVNFFRAYPLEGLGLGPIQATTIDGIAETVILKERDTPLAIRASSDLAAQSEVINIGPGIVDTPTPTVTPTLTPSATLAPTETPTQIPTATPEPTITPTSSPTPLLLQPPLPARPVTYIDLIYAIAVSLTIGGIAFTLGGDRFILEERLRGALVAVASGLVGYIFFIIIGITFYELEFVERFIRQNVAGHWVAPLFALVFAIIGVLVWHAKPGRVFGKKQVGKSATTE